MNCKKGFATVMLVASLVSPIFGQGSGTQQVTREQAAERVHASTALVLARRAADPVGVVGAGIVVRSNGILLTAYHLIKDSQYVQVRFNSGEIFDQVQVLGVDPRRDVAAIK